MKMGDAGMMSPTVLKPRATVQAAAAEAAAAVAAAGGSPRAQIDAARKSAHATYVYMPHQSSREMARRRRQIERAAARA